MNINVDTMNINIIVLIIISIIITDDDIIIKVILWIVSGLRAISKY